ncbi:MAG: methylmalonyl Co-A mutase-associated GTPase MeaB [Oligoflexia bacterium]|nr:methylmalonyl Co-A mutase-associated GTPase MeaB [Oligoflexia bacterium]
MKSAKKSHKNLLKTYLNDAQSGDARSLAKLLSFAEDNLFLILEFLSEQKINNKAIKFGITGPPGAGKSSLTNLLISELRAQNLKVAVIAIDPSSPFSGGALLGDRVRMSSHTEDKNVFIRSLGSRGGFGGLSAATGVMAKIFEVCGFDVVIIETVGVGQTELEVMNLVDVTSVILVPESGDMIQTLKAGILEIADIFVVNKSDRPGADILASELKNLVEQEAIVRAVIQTSALKNEGIKEWAESILNLAKKKNLNIDKKRQELLLRGELRNLVLFEVNKKLKTKLLKIKNLTQKNYLKEGLKILKSFK